MLLRTRRAAVAAVLGLCLGVGGCSGDRLPPNVLLVSVESLRADRLETYGNPRKTSPRIDQLGKQGVVFERALAPSASTVPSQVTLLTGREPQRHGALTEQDVVGARELTLAEILQRLRYETVGFHASPLLRASSGFGRGFESYESCEPPAIARLDSLAAARERSRGEPADALVEAAFGRWLEARKDDPRRAEQPFFALVQLSDVGMDYVPPESYAADFDPEYKGPLDGRDVAGKGLPANAAPRDVEHLRALYDAEVRATDDLIGRLLDALDAADLLDDTIVVVTATHGEELLEHGAKGPGRGVYIESVQVPLILWSGRGLPKKRRVPDTVGLVDVAPTLLQLALLPPPALLAFDGRSLLPSLRGEEVPAVPVRSVQADPAAPEQRMLAVREGSRTLLLSGPSGQAMVFDLARDPAERRPALLAPGFDRLPLDRLDAEVRAALALRAAGGGASVAASP